MSIKLRKLNILAFICILFGVSCTYAYDKGFDNLLGSAGSNVNYSSGTFTNATVGAIPLVASDVTNKNYVDSVTNALSVRDSVMAASTGAISLSGNVFVDSYTTVSGDRILVKNQGTIANGIYVASGGAWSRSTDYNQSAQAINGTFVAVTSGTQNFNTQWVMSSTGVVIGISTMTWSKLSIGNVYIAGGGLNLTINQFSVNCASVTCEGQIVVGSGGSSVYAATATIQAPKGIIESTETITSLSPGVMHIQANSSNTTTGLVSLSTETIGVYIASVTAGTTTKITGTNNVAGGAPIFNVDCASVTCEGQVSVGGGSGSSIYNATTTVGLPFGASISTLNVTSSMGFNDYSSSYSYEVSFGTSPAPGFSRHVIGVETPPALLGVAIAGSSLTIQAGGGNFNTGNTHNVGLPGGTLYLLGGPAGNGGSLSTAANGGSVFIAGASSGTIGNAAGIPGKVILGSSLESTQTGLPTVSSCGTGSPAVTAKSTDRSGSVTTGTAATACTITFISGFSNAPNCQVSGSSLISFPGISSTSTTAVTFGISGAVTGDVLYWLCEANQ